MKKALFLLLAALFLFIDCSAQENLERKKLKDFLDIYKRRLNYFYMVNLDADQKDIRDRFEDLFTSKECNVLNDFSDLSKKYMPIPMYVRNTKIEFKNIGAELIFDTDQFYYDKQDNKYNVVIKKMLKKNGDGENWKIFWLNFEIIDNNADLKIRKITRDVEPKDDDGDLVVNERDGCPTEKGSALTNDGCPFKGKDEDNDKFYDDEGDDCPGVFGLVRGCPDTDKDGIIDKEDSCPTQKGFLRFKGCPDTDGDGFPNHEDACPGEYGKVKGCPDPDKDNLVGDEDRCPDAFGKPETNGCPDTDGDGIPDGVDDCETEYGPANTKGCPDADGDGVPNKEDLCDEVKGPAETQGCPDTDKDGVIDIRDKCPSDYGEPRLGGCPDSDGDGVINSEDDCPGEWGDKENGCPKKAKDYRKEGKKVEKQSRQRVEFLISGSAVFTEFPEAETNNFVLWEGRNQGFKENGSMINYGWSAGLGLHFNPTKVWGLGFRGGYYQHFFDHKAWNRNLAIYHYDNNINYKAISTDPATYEGVYGLFSTFFGNLDGPARFKLEPWIGFLKGDLKESEISTRIDYDNQNGKNIGLNISYPFALLYGGEAAMSFRVSNNFRLGFACSFWFSTLNVEDQRIDFDTQDDFILYNELQLKTIQPSLNLIFPLNAKSQNKKQT